MFGIHLVETKEETIVAIPSSIFKDRNLAPLEAVTEFLKDQYKLSFHEIAVILNRDDRTVWTCYHRAKKKQSQASGDKTHGDR